MNRIPGQIVLRATSLAGRVHAMGLLEMPLGGLPSEHAMVIADVGPGLQLSVPQPVDSSVAEALACERLGDISFDTEAWFLESSLTEGQLFFRTLTAPASREGFEIMGFSGVLRLRGGELPALDEIHELSVNPANHMVEVLSAPATYGRIIGNVRPWEPDVIFTLPIWGFGRETLGFRSTFRADVQVAADRALESLAREHGHGAALTEDEDRELALLLGGPAGQLVGPGPLPKVSTLTFAAWFAAAFDACGLDGLRLTGARGIEAYNGFLSDSARLNAAIAGGVSAPSARPRAAPMDATQAP